MLTTANIQSSHKRVLQSQLLEFSQEMYANSIQNKIKWKSENTD